MFALLIRTSIPQPPPTLVTVAGDIDIASAPLLRRHLLSVPGSSTVLDLSGVQLLSAAGLTELVDLRDRLTRADARLVLAGRPATRSPGPCDHGARRPPCCWPTRCTTPSSW